MVSTAIRDRSQVQVLRAIMRINAAVRLAQSGQPGRLEGRATMSAPEIIPAVLSVAIFLGGLS